MITKEEIEEIAAKIQLTIDNPQSVRKQLQQLNLVQQRLMIHKRELRQSLKELNFNSQDNQHLTNSILTAGLPFLPNSTRKWRGVARAGAREVMRAQKNAASQPYVEIEQLIDDFLAEIANLRLEAQEYLLNHQ